MNDVNTEVKVAPDGTWYEFIPEDMHKGVARQLLDLMDAIKRTAENKDPIVGIAELQAVLKNCRFLDDLIKDGDACPACSKPMKTDGSFSIQMYSVAFVYLLKHRVITPKTITLPSVEMVTRELNKGFPYVVDLKCPECGFETLCPTEEMRLTRGSHK